VAWSLGGRSALLPVELRVLEPRWRPLSPAKGGREHQWAPRRTRAPHRILREIERSPQLVGRGPPVQALRRSALRLGNLPWPVGCSLCVGPLRCPHRAGGLPWVVCTPSYLSRTGMRLSTRTCMPSFICVAPWSPPCRGKSVRHPARLVRSRRGGCMNALAYGAANGVLPQFTHSLARELADIRIRVSCVVPRIIRARFQDYRTSEQ
jgi:NAD(P)-dependent dehydrogenase (short-subunit alcohol dehydrogenase family)